MSCQEAIKALSFLTSAIDRTNAVADMNLWHRLLRAEESSQRRVFCASHLVRRFGLKIMYAKYGVYVCGRRTLIWIDTIVAYYSS